MELAPESLKNNLALFSSEDERALLTTLLEHNQHHLFQSWDPLGTNDDLKRLFVQQVKELDHNCAGGISGYLSRAKRLLAAAAAGENPLEGWKPTIPSGVNLIPFDSKYKQYEDLGIPFLGKVGFVLVAGGLGERLGYSGIKVELPVDTITNTCYLKYYIEQILHMQKTYAPKGNLLPLAIMTSDDTHSKTLALLEQSNYFGMLPEQVTLMKQGKVPALISNDAQIALSSHSKYEIEAKPHGHGDVHFLLHKQKVAETWHNHHGVEYIIFFQDTNAHAFMTLPAMLGVSQALNLEINSLAVARAAKQAVGAIVRLVSENSQTGDRKELTVNVEYNQLDPLLRSASSSASEKGSGNHAPAITGDENDPETGLSPYPGNINTLLFRLPSYLKVLEESEGIMPEFVNPKYADKEKRMFKKPTRLECMMQDFPKLLLAHSDTELMERVGFTQAPAWLVYSPAKNNMKDAAVSVAQGIPAASPYTAESEFYGLGREILRLVGGNKVQISNASDLTIQGVTASPAPRVVFKPSYAVFPHELAARLTHLHRVVISEKSSVVISGNVELQRLELDGSLYLEGPEGSYQKLIVNVAEGSAVRNAGHEIVPLEGGDMTSLSEKDTMRGYLVKEREAFHVTVPADESFIYEGDLEKVTSIGQRDEGRDKKRAKLSHTADVPTTSNAGSCCGFEKI